MTTPRHPSVAVLMRLFEDEPYVLKALKSVIAQDYPGQVTVYVSLDEGSKDRTAELVREVTQTRSPGFPNIAWHLIPHEHQSLDWATRMLIATAKEDEIYFLDGDNWWEPNRLSSHIALHPEPKGLCCCRCYQVGRSAEPVTFPVPWPELTFERLFAGNFVDSIMMRLKRSFAQDRVLKLLESVPTDNLIDDWLIALLAAFDEELCVHPEPLGTYRWRSGSLTERTDMVKRTRATRGAVWGILERLASA